VSFTKSFKFLALLLFALLISERLLVPHGLPPLQIYCTAGANIVSRYFEERLGGAGSDGFVNRPKIVPHYSGGSMTAGFKVARNNASLSEAV
jgi:hypothetical protein